MQGQALGLQRRCLGFQLRQARLPGLLEGGVAALLPALQHVRDVVLRHRQALVVQREAVVRHVVEPDLLGLGPAGEEQHGGRDAGIGLEHAGRHGDHPVQAVVFDDALAQGYVRLAGAEQHPVRHDHRAAPAHVQGAQDQVHKQQLGLGRVAGQAGADIPLVHRPLEGRVHQDHVVLALVAEALGERVHVEELRRFDAVQHQVHRADAQHGHARIVVEATQEFVRLDEGALVLLEQVADQVVRQPFLVVFEDVGRGGFLHHVLVGVDQEAGRAARQVADPVGGRGRDHLHHHADDVARRAELPVAPGGVELAEQVFVQVALHVLVLLRDFHLVDQLAGFDQQGGLADLALGVGHVALERAALLAQRAEPGEDGLFEMAQRLAGLVASSRSASASRPGCGLVVRLAPPGLPLQGVLAVIQAFQKQQIRELLDGVQRVGQPARPEFVPQGVDLRFEFGVGQHRAMISLSSRCSAHLRSL